DFFPPNPSSCHPLQQHWIDCRRLVSEDELRLDASTPPVKRCCEFAQAVRDFGNGQTQKCRHLFRLQMYMQLASAYAGAVYQIKQSQLPGIVLGEGRSVIAC